MAITITESGRLVVTIGRRGVPGVGVIAGGTTGQVLSKASATDYDMEWSAAGSGDMASAVYDPSSVAGDAFDMENMAEGATNKILSSAERTQLTALTGAAGGTTGQIATKASGDDYDLTWSDNLTVPGLLTANHIHGNIAGTLYIHVKNTSGGTLAKGTPVYVTGHVGSSDRVEVAAADQSDPAKMPAIALLAEELANNGEGDGVIVGEIRTFDTDTPGYALNDELFVGTGALTATKPTSGAVQPVATVGRLQSSTGVLVINCQGQRSPDETFAPALGADDNYVTDAEKVVIGNTSGTNTGDQDLSGLALKSNVLELDNTDAFTPDADYEPATKKYVDDNSGGSGDLLAANNLSDLANAATARTNLGLGTAATTAASAYAPALGADDNYVTDAEKVVIGNTSGTNTGDQDLSGYVAKTDPFWVEVVLTGSGEDIAAGTNVAYLTHTVAGTVTDFKIVCDPANEPSAAAVQVDMNSINLSTGAATSRLSSVAQIATSANVSTGGAISGTQTVAFGDQTSFDIDQGSDGKELRALVEITPS